MLLPLSLSALTFDQKVQGLDARHALPASSESGNAAAATALPDPSPALQYFSSEKLFAVPFLAEKRPGGGYLDGECRVFHSSMNDNAILQPFDRLTLKKGGSEGVKVGDRFRIYDLGRTHREHGSEKKLGRLVQPVGLAEVLKVHPDRAEAQLLQCVGPIDRNARAHPYEAQPAFEARAYRLLPDSSVRGRIVAVSAQQHLAQPYTYALVDAGSGKGFKLGDIVTVFSDRGDRPQVGRAVVLHAGEGSSTLLFQRILPGRLRLGDLAIATETPEP